MPEAGERVVIGRKGASSFTKVQWTDECPEQLNDLEYAEELGAKWEDDELVTYDLPAMKEFIGYYEKDEYIPDND